MPQSRLINNRVNTNLISSGIAAYVAVGGVISFLGWVADLPRLADWANTGISIQPNTAVCAVAAGIALILANLGQTRIALGLGILVAAIASGAVIENIFDINLGIDTPLMFNRTWGAAGTISPGRMGPPGSISWTLIGISLILKSIGTTNTRRIVPVIALAICSIGTLSLVGYLFRASMLFTLPRFTVIAWQTATFILAMGIGLIASVPEHGLMSMLLRDDLAAFVVRRTLLPILVGPIALGWIRLWGERAGYYDTAFGTGARTLCEIVFLLMLLWWTASSIARIESLRNKDRKTLADRDVLLSAVTENAAVGLVVVDPQHHYVYANRSYLDILGLSTDQIVGQRVADVLKNAYEQQVRPKLERAFSGQRIQYDLVLPPVAGSTAANGDQRLFNVTYEPQYEQGQVKHVVVAITNVTEAKRTDELRSRLASIVESSDDAIISKTLDSIITTWNYGAEHLFGYTAAEAIGKSITILIPPEHLDEETEILGRIRRGERIKHYETVRVRKDGSPLDVSLTVSPLRDSSGTIIGASKIARDITAQKLLQKTLEEETRVLELLNKTGASITSKLDLQELIQVVTDAATELSGAKFGAFFYNVTNEIGESFLLYSLSGAPREAFEKFGLPRNTPVFNPTFRGEEVVRSADITNDPRYGRMDPHHGMPKGHLPVRSYLAVPVISRTGEVIGGLFFGHPDVGVFTERSERIVLGVAAQAAVAIDNARLYENLKKASAERERSLEAERAARSEAERVSLMKDEFLATLSHELRTPLNAILGWAQILQPRSSDDGELQEGLAVIQRNARVQTQLIEDLLDMSRIISGKIRLDVQQVDLQDVVKAAIASVRHSADAREIRLHAVMDPLAGPVRGDPNRLQQCFWNLLSNAIKFTPKGGKIQVSLERVSSHVEVCVIDNGQGIKPEFLPHVFERFRQADASTTRRHGGLGLGLSIVKNLVELHGGSIRAKSPGEGQGATFCIELPLLVVHPPPDQTDRTHPKSVRRDEPMLQDHPSLKGISVLVVDDEPDARDLLRRVLEECGAQVFVAASASQGLAIVQRERPKMIISDIGMPEQDGYDFIRQVRKLKPEQGGLTPAAALTAFARAEDRTRALRAGFQTHVAKPVEPSELTAVVASLASKA